MKQNGIYHSELSLAVSKMGHGDIILIGDVGCAWPQHGQTTCIDLAVSDGIPMVKDVLAAVLQELVVERYIVAEETIAVSPESYQALKAVLSKSKCQGHPVAECVSSHQVMKELWLHGALNGDQMKVFIRTGERTPYGYIMLVAGVDF